jgi:hypothetical protein
MNVRRGVVRVLIGIVVLGALGTGGLLLTAIHQRELARAFLEDVNSLQLGRASLANAQQLAAKYGGKPWNGPSREPTCSYRDCVIRFVFKNKLLAFLPRRRELSLAAGVTVEDGLVVAKELDFSLLSTTWTTQFTYILFDRVSSPAANGYKVGRFKIDSSGRAHVVQAELGPNAPPEVRKNLYSLDLSCLAQLSGCNAPNAVFPAGL